MKIIKTYEHVKVIGFKVADHYKWCVEDLDGNRIVPYGKYDWIDGFDSGLARVKIGKEPNNKAKNNNKWGIINEQGEEVLPVEYDNIWNFLGKGRNSTKVEKDGMTTLVYFRNLNPELEDFVYDEYEDEEYEPYERNDIYDDIYGTRHYDEYAGSYAQEYAGYSDEEINLIFDGNPDAYWNID